jgi:hypothetical protein
MTNKEIKTETENCYKTIKQAEDRLTEIRAICPHEKTFIGNYMWRVGHIQQAHICKYCGQFIKYV